MDRFEAQGRVWHESVENRTVAYAIWCDFWQLTKARLSVSIVFSAVAGYLLAVDSVEIKNLLVLISGGYLMVGASNVFNQIIERDKDRLMHRTRNRPLPAGRVSITAAFYLGLLLAIGGLTLLCYLSFQAAVWAFVSIILYVFAYTPLKAVTPWSVFVGAFPGAIPYMLGWVAASNSFNIEPGTLFLIQFLWQFPHFWAIGWLAFVDYGRAGYNLLPSGGRDRSTARQIAIYSFSLIPISIWPAFGLTGSLHLSVQAAVWVIICGAIFFGFSLRLHQRMDSKSARDLLLVSVVYLPVVQIIYVVDKFVRCAT